MKAHFLTLICIYIVIKLCRSHDSFSVTTELTEMTRVNHQMTCRAHVNNQHSYQCCTAITLNADNFPICIVLKYDFWKKVVYQSLTFSRGREIFRRPLSVGEKCGLVRVIPFRRTQLCLHTFHALADLKEPNLKYTSCNQLSLWWNDERFVIPINRNCVTYDKNKPMANLVGTPPGNNGNDDGKEEECDDCDQWADDDETLSPEQLDLRNEIGGIVDDLSPGYRSSLPG